MSAVIRNLSPSYWISRVTTKGRGVYLEPCVFLWILMCSILVPGLPTKRESSPDGPRISIATTAYCCVRGIGTCAPRWVLPGYLLLV